VNFFKSGNKVGGRLPDVTGFRTYHTRSSECRKVQSFSNPEDYGDV